MLVYPPRSRVARPWDGELFAPRCLPAVLVDVGFLHTSREPAAVLVPCCVESRYEPTSCRSLWSLDFGRTTDKTRQTDALSSVLAHVYDGLAGDRAPNDTRRFPALTGASAVRPAVRIVPDRGSRYMARHGMSIRSWANFSYTLLGTPALVAWVVSVPDFIGPTLNLLFRLHV